MDASPNSARSEDAPVVILGLGYTGARLARRLLLRNYPVIGITRDISKFDCLQAIGLKLLAFNDAELLPGCTIIQSIPPLSGHENEALRARIRAWRPKRIVYVSSTGVYGSQFDVDENSTPEPVDDKGRRRLDEEQWIAAGHWSSLIVRSAAIYGPRRGVHTKIFEGRLPRGAAGVVSRIHVDDLASILAASVHQESEGAWPVADQQPCCSEEIAIWLARYSGIIKLATRRDFPVTGRKVDGGALPNKLGVRLLYTGYEAGILASIAEERVFCQKMSSQESV